MRNKDKIERGFQALFEGKLQTVPAIVDAVDEEKQTCDVSPVADTYTKMKGVRLKALVDNQQKGVIIIPAIGSQVLVTLVLNSTQKAFVSCFSLIEKMIIVNESDYRLELTDEKLEAVVGESKLTIEDGKVTINDGSLGGLIKIEELKAELKKNSDAIQVIMDVLTGWVFIAQDGGAALQTAAKAAFATLQVGEWDNIENDKVVHG